MLRVKRFENSAEGTKLEKLLQEASLKIAPDKNIAGYIFKDVASAEMFLADKIGHTKTFYLLLGGTPALILPAIKNNLEQTTLIACIDEFEQYTNAKDVALAFTAAHEMGHVHDEELYSIANDLAKKYDNSFMQAAPTALSPYESSAGEIIINTVLECRADKRAIDAGYGKEYIDFLEKISPEMFSPHLIFTFKMLEDAGYVAQAKELQKKFWSSTKQQFKPDLVEKIYAAGAHLDNEELAKVLLSYVESTHVSQANAP
jgi:hypothetical protein